MIILNDTKENNKTFKLLDWTIRNPVQWRNWREGSRGANAPPGSSDEGLLLETALR